MRMKTLWDGIFIGACPDTTALTKDTTASSVSAWVSHCFRLWRYSSICHTLGSHLPTPYMQLIPHHKTFTQHLLKFTTKSSVSNLLFQECHATQSLHTCTSKHSRTHGHKNKLNILKGFKLWRFNCISSQC